MSDKVNEKKHKHTWVLSSTQFQYPANTGTGMAFPLEYAYLLCQCGEVRKTLIKEIYEPK